MTNVMISGALANKYRNGGGAWERMSWVIGLQKLGFNVLFVEQIDPKACTDSNGTVTRLWDSIQYDWFRSVTERFQIAAQSVLVTSDAQQSAGASWSELLRQAETCDLLVNLSGQLTMRPILERIRTKAYVDVDPGFTQFWHVDANTSFKLAKHEFYFTIGENIGRPGCAIPTGGIEWRTIRQPVVLSDWRFIPPQESHRARHFTTIASWRGAFGPVSANGRRYGLKVHEFRKFIKLPHAVPNQVFEIALDIHPGDHKDRAAMEEAHWRLLDPRETVGGVDDFRSYIQHSDAEFSVAQGIYVDTNSGWFSDRSIRYLASGKPVLVQETGFSDHIPVGRGLLSFRNLDEAIEGANAIVADYPPHAHAARGIAEKYFDSDLVLRAFAAEVGLLA